ncbi:alcohol dehydrogenase-like protein [Xylaria cf. heliscus]|nr:alcohol dehydrogenase-like protein [Xylaria cf. heliscus]
MFPRLPRNQQSAVICQSKSPGTNLRVTDSAPLPLPISADQILVRTVAVAINPCDWKMPDNFPSIGSIGGSDFAGTIVALGSDVQASHPALHVGDRVCGAVHGFNPANPTGGCFSEYVAATADILLKIPNDVSWEEAAAIGGTGIATLGIVFFEHLKLDIHPLKPTVSRDPFPVLVYGGGTATGTMAIQLLKALGLRPLAVCSSQSAGLALSYGAEKTFDYNDPSCSADIKHYTRGRLGHVVDIIANSDSLKLCYDAMGRLGGTYVGLELLPDEKPKRQLIKPSWVMGQTVFGKALLLDGGYERPAMAEHRELGKRWFGEVQDLWDRKVIRPHPVRVGPDVGLHAVIEGVGLLRSGAIAREKLVYFLQSSEVRKNPGLS